MERTDKDSQLPLTIDMIKAISGNRIPPNGIHSKEADKKLDELYTRFHNNPQDPDARLDFLRYAAPTGNPKWAKFYLFIINNLLEPELRELPNELKLQEAQLLADLYMNAAEAARRAYDYYVNIRHDTKESAKMLSGDPLDYLKTSLQYQKQAEELKRELEQE